MNRKQVITAFVVLVLGVALYLFLRHTHRAAGASEEETPTVVSVQVGHLTRATLHGFVSGYGTVQPAPAAGDEPAATARLASPVAGVVSRVLVTEGAKVARGAPVADLDARAAEIAVKYAQASADRQHALYAQNNTSLKSLQDAEAQLATARAQLALLHITAPLSGTVTRVNVRPGESVDLATVVAEITDLDRLVVAVEIPSSEAADVQVGQRLEIDGPKPIPTAVAYVSPAVDPANDTVLVRALVPPDSGLRPGAAVRVRIVTAEHVDCLAAPAESVVTDQDGKNVVAVVNGDEATQVPVVTGLHEGDLVEIKGAGLEPGNTVVTVGAYGLPEKTRIQVTKP